MKLLFVITQFYKGGAEVALLNLLRKLSPEQYEIDLLIFDQIILSGAKSLIPELPDYVNVCNASQREGRMAILFKIFFKVVQKITGHQLYRSSAYRFVRDKHYDMAFSYGEWLSPEFVAKKVTADRKYIWIHTDVDKAKYVDSNILFGYDDAFAKYIFVSEHSRKAAENSFPMLLGKTAVVANLHDEAKIIELSKEPVPEKNTYSRYLLVSVGNIRKEKNYFRQVEVMRILKEKGTDVTWLCIGSTAKRFLYQKIKRKIKSYGLENDFLLCGVKDNPYKYMALADAVMVLSDYESWSMVITEAKILGIPVIATKTSGALEQIKEGKDGILVSFNPEEIADSIQKRYLS